MRFRTDSAHIAELKRQGETWEKNCHGGWPTRELWDATPPAQAGDVWRVRWALTVDQKAAGMTEGLIAGYAIACNKCNAVHRWTTAINCQPRVPWSVTWKDENGQDRTSSGTHLST